MHDRIAGDVDRSEKTCAKKAGRDGVVAYFTDEENATDEGSAVDESASNTVQRDKLALNYLVSVLGFGLCRAWIVFCFAAPMIHGASSSSNWMYLVFGAVAALFVWFAVRRLNSNIDALRCALYRITLPAVIVSGVVIPVAFALNHELLLAAGFIIGGIGAGLLQVLWGDRFACHRMKFAALASPAAAIITALVIAVSTDHTSFVGFAIIPLLSFGLLLFEADRTNLSVKSLFSWRNAAAEAGMANEAAGIAAQQAASSETSPVPAAQSGAAAVAADNAESSSQRNVDLSVGKLMFSIMTFSFLCRLFDAIPTSSDPFAFLGGSVIFALVLVGTIFLLIVALLRERFDATLTYRLSLPIMVAGFVAIALFFDTHAALSLLLINVGYEFFDILAWVLFTEVSRRRNENALHIFGLGVAFMFIGMALGYLAGNVVDTLVLNGTVQITVVAMLATLSLVVVAFMVIPEGVVAQLAHAVRSEKKEEAARAAAEATNSSEDDAPRTDRIEAHCASVAQEFGLTPRESEVIVLLAYGRTLSIIARDLQIAKGTARTHIENIYRKLDVHKQQELIDLVESYKD